MCKRTAEEVSLEWSHPCRISFTDSKVRTTTVHTESIKVLYHVKVITIIIIIIIIITIIIMTMMKNNNKNKSNTKWYFVDHVTVESR